jgi:hypothetical protein
MVVLVYLLAFALSVVLLITIHSRPWYLHILAILAALALGFMHIPEQWKGVKFDLMFGGVILFLLVWGVGGLLTLHIHHHEKHA